MTKPKELKVGDRVVCPRLWAHPFLIVRQPKKDYGEVGVECARCGRYLIVKRRELRKLPDRKEG